MANAGVDPSRLYSTLDRTALRAKDPVLYQLLYNLIGTLVNVVGKQSGSGGSTPNNIVNNVTNVIQQMMLDGGIDGEMGVPGQRGTDGTIGHDGATGPAGPPGLAGLDGIDGEIYAIPGPQGPMGNNGTNGNDGATGPPGPPGLQGFEGMDGETYAIPGVQGPVGNTGPALVAGAAQVNRSTNQTITAASETAVTLDTVVYDTNSYWNVSNPTRLTVPTGQDGKYIVHGQVKWAITGALTSTAIIGAKVYRATNQTISNNSATQISLSTVEFDTNTFWSAGSPTRLTVPTNGDGIYVIIGQVKWSVGASGPAFIRIFKNGTTIIGESYIETVNANSTSNVSCEESLAATDFIELQVFQVTGSSQTAAGGVNTYLSMEATVTSSPGGGSCFTRIYKNGSTLVGEGFVPLSDAVPTSSVTTEVSLIAGDYLELKVFQRTGLSQTITGGTSTYFAVELAAGNGGITPALVLLANAVASSSATLDFVNRNVNGQAGPIFNTDFDEYLIEGMMLVPATNGVQAQLLVSTNGGSTYDTGANYQWAVSIQTPQGSTGFTSVGSATGASAGLIGGANNIANTSVGGGIRFTIRVYDPLNAAAHKFFGCENGALRNSGDSNHYRLNGGVWYISTSAVNALRFLFSSGNIASGGIRIYGIAPVGVSFSGNGGGIGKLVQTVNIETGAVNNGTTTVPIDDTIPQITEGDQYMSLSITPTNALNKLRIDVVAFLSPSVTAWIIASVFQDSTANALATMADFTETGTAVAFIAFTHWMTAGTTSPTTIKFRAGMDRAGTTTFNGGSGTRKFGGAMASSITISEIIP